MKIMKLLKTAVICFGIMTILCGIIYTAAVTGAAQLLFPDQANGSMIVVTQKDGTQKEYGSQLLAQEFTKPQYLIGRPSGVTNLSPVSKEQKTLVLERINWWHSFDPRQSGGYSHGSGYGIREAALILIFLLKRQNTRWQGLLPPGI